MTLQHAEEQDEEREVCAPILKQLGRYWAGINHQYLTMKETVWIGERYTTNQSSALKGNADKNVTGHRSHLHTWLPPHDSLLPFVTTALTEFTLFKCYRVKILFCVFLVRNLNKNR